MQPLHSYLPHVCIPGENNRKSESSQLNAFRLTNPGGKFLLNKRSCFATESMNSAPASCSSFGSHEHRAMQYIQGYTASPSPRQLKKNIRGDAARRLSGSPWRNIASIPRHAPEHSSTGRGRLFFAFACCVLRNCTTNNRTTCGNGKMPCRGVLFTAGF